MDCSASRLAVRVWSSVGVWDNETGKYILLGPLSRHFLHRRAFEKVIDLVFICLDRCRQHFQDLVQLILGHTHGPIVLWIQQDNVTLDVVSAANTEA